MTYLNLSAQLILLGQEGNVSREPFARIFPSKIVRDRRELIDLIRSTGFDDRWPWAAEWQKFSNFLLFFCLFTGYWWWWLAEKANTFSVCSHLAGGKWIQSEVNSGLLKFNRCAIFRRIFVKLELIDSPWVDLQFWFWVWSYWMKRSAVKWRKRTLVRAFFVCHAASSWLTYDPTVSWIELHLQDVE